MTLVRFRNFLRLVSCLLHESYNFVYFLNLNEPPCRMKRFNSEEIVIQETFTQKDQSQGIIINSPKLFLISSNLEN